MDYITHTEQDYKRILSELQIENIEDLLKAIPSHIRPKTLNLDSGKSEIEVKQYFHGLLKKNTIKQNSISFLGAGAYHHFIPEVISSLISRGEFLTAYTPYQPEISQGLLQSTWEFQQLMAHITGMEVSNASLYEGGSAVMEAVIMASQIQKKNKIIISETLNPQYIEVLKTYNLSNKFNFVFVPEKKGLSDIQKIESLLDDQTACVVIPYINYFGNLEPFDSVVESSHNVGALFVSTFYPIASGLYQTPGKRGADIVVGEAQSLGIPLNFGGPYLGFIASRKAYVRQLPGRIVGKTIDVEGKEAFVLTLQAREQHIKREKASSNICSNEALCALRSSIYLSLMGEKGLHNVAQKSYERAHYFYDKIKQLSFVKPKYHHEFFNEFVVEFSSSELRNTIISKLEKENIFIGVPLNEKDLLIATTEMNTKQEIDFVVNAIENKGEIDITVSRIKDYTK